MRNMCRAPTSPVPCSVQCMCDCLGFQICATGPWPLTLLPPLPCWLQLRETGTPLEQIQVGRAEGDDESWGDLLEMETGDTWMRFPPPVNELLEMLGDPPAPAAAAAPAVPAKQQQGGREGQEQQQQQQRHRREQPPPPPAS